jgi:hypothetical protein
VLSVLKSQIGLSSRQPHILLLPLHTSTENTSTDFILPEDTSLIPILRKKIRSRPAKKFSRNANVFSVYEKIRGLFQETKIVSAWQTENRKQETKRLRRK